MSIYTPHKMYFNTGVRPENRPGTPLGKFQVWRGGVLQIIYYLQVAPPEGWVVSHLCDTIQPDEANRFIPVVGGGMLSKYAIFKTKGATTLEHVEYCPFCDEEVEYITDRLALTAVKCPTDNCNHAHIHCDACIHQEVPWHQGTEHPDCQECPWHEEACPDSGELVPIHESFKDTDLPIHCPSCGSYHTWKEYVDSWAWDVV